MHGIATVLLADMAAAAGRCLPNALLPPSALRLRPPLPPLKGGRCLVVSRRRQAVVARCRRSSSSYY